jgi:DNA polymerase I-like protein with 3'-5' exonuclease and polymerase domains
MLVSLDVETACGVGCEGKCDHALDEHRNRITVVGIVTSSGERRTFRCLDELRSWLDTLPDWRVLGHAFKFDIKTLAAKGLDLSERWEDDTLLMAAVLTEKVSEEYLAWYERERARRKALGESHHRQGSAHSLKVLAPYFVGVPAFWETASHDDDSYVLADVEYTLKLHAVLEQKLKAEGSYGFYKEKLLPFTRMLLASERAGISLDLGALSRHEELASQTTVQARAKLDTLWADAYAKWEGDQKRALYADYLLKADAAVARLKDKTKEQATRARYATLYAKAAEKLPRFNLDSPTQLTWLLKDHLGLDIADFDGEETTGKAVLQRLSAEGREDIATFLTYRKAQKLSQAFFPSYRAMHWEGVIHTSFNPTGTRTGRLSSSSPNLQQVSKDIHDIFVARPGYKLATFDMSAIEPRLIAFYTGDLNLFEIVTSGADFHGTNAKVFFDLECPVSEVKKRYPKQREVGKEVGLLLMYGGGYKRLQESAMKRGFVWSEKECRRKVERFKEFYEGVYRFRDEEIAPALRRGETLVNLLGRPFRIPDPDEIHLKGMNTLIQSGASDLVLNSAHRMTKTFEERGIDARVLLLVHDEIVTEIPADRASECEAIIVESMTNYRLESPLGLIPLAVEGKIAASWEK